MIQWFSKKMNKKRAGFTLIELIVVIAILGILAAIAVPRFTNVSAKAKTDADAATARSIESAINIAVANGDIPVGTAADDVGALLTPNYLQEVPESQVTGLKGWLIAGTYANGYTVTAGATLAASNFK